MKIWIVNPYGELPSEGWREYRSFMLAKALVARGHSVTWWISDFIHRRKDYRSQDAFCDPLLPKGVRVISVHTTPYKRNISWERVLYERNYGQELVKLAVKEDEPDIIVMADPALFFGKPILDYRYKAGCRLVLDIIDLWPELFEITLPKFLRPLGRLVFSPFYHQRKTLISQCDGVVAVSKDYLKTAMRGKESHYIPAIVAYLGIDCQEYRQTNLNPLLDAQLKNFRHHGKLIAVYAGTLGDAYDISIILKAVEHTSQNQLPIQFIVAGEGPRRRTVEIFERDFPEILKFLGPLPASDMRTLYENADVGLMTYVQDSTVAMPVKFFDYLAGGVAILNSLDRDVKDIIIESQVGVNYKPLNFNDFIFKLCTLAENSKQLEIFKCNSRKLLEKFDSRIQYKSFSSFLEKISGSCSP